MLPRHANGKLSICAAGIENGPAWKIYITELTRMIQGLGKHADRLLRFSVRL